MLAIQTQKKSKENLHLDKPQSITERVYLKLLEKRTDVNEGNLKAIAEYRTRGSQSFYAAWVEPKLQYNFPKNSRFFRDFDSYFIITTDRQAMEDFIIEEVYGLKHPFK